MAITALERREVNIEGMVPYGSHGLLVPAESARQMLNGTGRVMTDYIPIKIKNPVEEVYSVEQPRSRIGRLVDSIRRPGLTTLATAGLLGSLGVLAASPDATADIITGLQKTIEWWNVLSQKEQIGVGIMGAASILPLAGIAKGAHVFAETKGGISQRLAQAVNAVYSDSHIVATLTSALFAQSMLATELFGYGGAEYAWSGLAASQFVAILVPFAGVDRRAELAHATHLQTIASSLAAFPIAVLLGTYFHDAQPADVADLVSHLTIEVIPGYMTPVTAVAAGWMTNFLLSFNRMSVASRLFTQEVKLGELEAAPWVNRLIGELRINRSHNAARHLTTALLQNNLTRIPSMLDESFRAIAEDRASQNAEEVINMRGNSRFRGDERIRWWDRLGRKVQNMLDDTSESFSEYHVSSDVEGADEIMRELKFGSGFRGAEPTNRWWDSLLCGVQIGPAIPLDLPVVEFSPSLESYRDLVETEIAERTFHDAEAISNLPGNLGKRMVAIMMENLQTTFRRRPRRVGDEFIGH